MKVSAWFDAMATSLPRKDSPVPSEQEEGWAPAGCFREVKDILLLPERNNNLSVMHPEPFQINL